MFDVSDQMLDNRGCTSPSCVCHLLSENNYTDFLPDICIYHRLTAVSSHIHVHEKLIVTTLH